MVEAERVKLEEYMRGEVTGAMQMTSALRGELERRLDELTAAHKESDEAKGDMEANNAKMAEMRKIMERQEGTFKRTLETDRNKISGEIKTKMQKLRGLEIEKQELLMETSQLMKQVETTQKDLNEARTAAEGSQQEAKAAQMKVQELMDEKEVLSKQASTAVQSQEELRAHANRLESSFKEDIGRLDGLVKESKKAAAHQVLEISDRVKTANEEVEIVRAQMKHAADNEKKAVEKMETVRVQMELGARSHEDMQQQMAKDMTTMRRELQENRTKSKISSESRTKMEMEVMNARMEATKAENEVVKMTEWCREIDVKMTQANADSQNLKLERNDLDRDYNKLKLKHVEMEESVSKKSAANEAYQKDMAKLEREGLAQTRTLRLQLQASEQEAQEMKVQIPLLQKELLDGKGSFEKMQGSTNETVNGLLEELRNTEDALSTERRKSQLEVDTMRSKVHELTTNLEKANEHIRENVDRSKSSSHDREVRVLQLEQELERIKQAVILKESRMDELEKQHQADRGRITEMKGNLDSAERSIADGRTTLELEQAQRARLEIRIKAFTEADRIKAETGQFSPRSSTFVEDNALGLGLGLAPSSIEKRTQLLYGDVGEPEPAYDDVQSSESHNNNSNRANSARAYTLDHESTIDVIGEDAKKASPVSKNLKKILETGIAGDDDDFMAMEQNNPHLRSNPNPNPSFDHLEVPDKFRRGEAMQGSPAVDRVSQALAARAAAESSKANLKLANQRRQDDRTGSSGMRQSVDDSQYEHYEGGRERSSPGSAAKSMVRDVREMVTSASANDIDDGSDSSMTDANGNPTGEVEDSIQRTQMFLRQRLAARANKSIEAAAAPAGSGSAARDKDKYISDEQSAAIAAKEAQRIAEMAYRRHGQEQENGSENGAVGEGGEAAEYEMAAPKLSPAKPMNSINGGYSTQHKSNYSNSSHAHSTTTPSGGRIVYEEEGDTANGVSLPRIKKGGKR